MGQQLIVVVQALPPDVRKAPSGLGCIDDPKQGARGPTPVNASWDLARSKGEGARDGTWEKAANGFWEKGYGG